MTNIITPIATIEKIFKSETSHIVRGAVSDRCRVNIHGHSYIYHIEIEGPIEENGMVLDFIELKPIGQFIDKFDHANIFWSEEKRDIVEFFKSNFERVLVMKKNCTAENMARLVFKFVSDWVKTLGRNDIKVKKVKIFETTTGSSTARECDENDVFTYEFSK